MKSRLRVRLGGVTFAVQGHHHFNLAKNCKNRTECEMESIFFMIFKEIPWVSNNSCQLVEFGIYYPSETRKCLTSASLVWDFGKPCNTNTLVATLKKDQNAMNLTK